MSATAQKTVPKFKTMHDCLQEMKRIIDSVQGIRPFVYEKWFRASADMRVVYVDFIRELHYGRTVLHRPVEWSTMLLRAFRGMLREIALPISWTPTPAQAELMVQCMREHKIETVIDAGAGVGVLSGYLKNVGFTVYSYDNTKDPENTRENIDDLRKLCNEVVIREEDVVAAVKNHHQADIKSGRTALAMFAPPTDAPIPLAGGGQMSRDVLTEYYNAGGHLVVFGGWESGCGTKEFWSFLQKHFSRIKEMKRTHISAFIPDMKHWKIDSNLFIYKRI